MDDQLKKHVDKMLELYSTGEFSSVVMEAKKEYTDLTGMISDEDDSYESRMNCFNDWYLFHYQYKEDLTLARFYASTNELSRDVEEALESVHYSVFFYTKDNFRGKMVLKDLIYGKKFVIDDSSQTGVVIGDVFVGRIARYKECYVLLHGVALIPNTVKKIIKREAKRVKKSGSSQAELSLLYKLENYAIKSMRYCHIDPQKIFVFP